MAYCFLHSGLWKSLQCLSKVTILSCHFLRGGNHTVHQYWYKEKKQEMAVKSYQEIQPFCYKVWIQPLQNPIYQVFHMGLRLFTSVVISCLLSS